MSADSGKKCGVLSLYFQSNLLMRILLGLALGAVVGILLGFSPDSAAAFIKYGKFFGDLFIRLLRMIVVPVILFSLIGGAASIAPTHLGRVGLKIMAYYLITSAFAVSLGLILAGLLKPGLGFNIAGSDAAKVAVVTAPNLVDVFLNIIPTNPIDSLARGDLLPIIFFAICFGIAISAVKNSGNSRAAKAAENLFEVCTAAAEAMYQIVAGVMQYAPIGIFVLIAIVFAQQGPHAIGTLLLITVTCFIGYIIHFIFCYGGFLTILGLSFPNFIKESSSVMVTALVTRSSNGTLPLTLKVTEEKLGAPLSISSFSLPLGASINMDGTAIYLGVCAMFIGYATGMPLTFDQQATVVLTATLASIGTAGVPGAGAIMILMVMDSIGMGVVTGTNIAAAYAMILGIDAILDMGRTWLNVTGDMVGTVFVAKTEKQLDLTKWQ